MQRGGGIRPGIIILREGTDTSQVSCDGYFVLFFVFF